MKQKFRVWLAGAPLAWSKITIETRSKRLTTMNVRDHCCRMGVFKWEDHQRIRHQRVRDD